MALVTYGDLMSPTPSNPKQRVVDNVLERVRDDTKPMPQPPNARLDAAAMATLDRWVHNGAQPSTATCSDIGKDKVRPLSCKPDTFVRAGSDC